MFFTLNVSLAKTLYAATRSSTTLAASQTAKPARLSVIRHFMLSIM